MEEVIQQQHRGFRVDYDLEETIRSQPHMIVAPTPQEALYAVEILQNHDFAFVKRSNGTYSYAILAEKPVQPVKRKRSNNQNSMEECMVFVLDGNVSTKIISRRYWGDLVWVVSLRD